jgi:hypothetical protein
VALLPISELEPVSANLITSIVEIAAAKFDRADPSSRCEDLKM